VDAELVGGLEPLGRAGQRPPGIASIEPRTLAPESVKETSSAQPRSRIAPDTGRAGAAFRQKNASVWRMAASIASSRISSWETSACGSPTSIRSGTSVWFAPGTTTIWFSPDSSTRMSAMPARPRAMVHGEAQSRSRSATSVATRPPTAAPIV